MAKISKDLGAGGTLHPRETLYATGSLGSLNAEVQVPGDGESTVAVDLRSGVTNVTATIQVQGTVDGTNWVLIPIRPVAGGIYVLGVVGGGAPINGVWVAACAGFRTLRVIATAYTSGSVTAVIAGSTGVLDQLNGAVTSGIGTAVGAASAAVTLTLAAPGVGLRHYLTYLSINRYAAALLVGSATPVTVTTTNLPGALAFTFPADALALGGLDRWREDFAFPIAASAQNTATTIVCPVVTNVIWRVTAGFFVAP